MRVLTTIFLPSISEHYVVCEQHHMGQEILVDFGICHMGKHGGVKKSFLVGDYELNFNCNLVNRVRKKTYVKFHHSVHQLV